MNRALPWAAAVVLLAGIGAFAATRGGDGDGPPSAATTRAPAATQEPARKSVMLDPQAKQVAADFISTAVARKELRRSWALAHPELRAGYTLKEWLTGTIPVQYYPAEDVELATFKIDESYEDTAVLEVALLPEAGAGVKPQLFFIELKRYGPERRWGVTYWAPRSTPGSRPVE